MKANKNNANYYFYAPFILYGVYTVIIFESVLTFSSLKYNW